MASACNKQSIVSDKKPTFSKEKEKPRPRALTLSLISISAALYAVAIAITSPIPTPWGVGHFRPGVVVPAFFSIVFGSIVGGVGAAIGCFIGDLALYLFGLTTPLLSLVAGVPGNFVGFYLLGWFVSKKHSLASFILGNLIALIVGNLVAALGVLAYFWFIDPDWALWPMELKFGIVMGLTLFWLTTMIVFVVPLVPILVRCIEPRLTRIGVRGVSNLSWGSPIGLVKSSVIVSLILTATYILVVFVPGGNLLFAGVVPPELLLLASAVTFVSGIFFAMLAQRLEKSWPAINQE